MFNAISGLQSDSTWLDVIGNNISNTNTVGYKASRVEFADQISQTLSGGTGDHSGTGGVDPQQVGLGTKLASIEALFTQGPTLTTGISTDISIQGNGFLMAKQGDQNYLTRAGDLTFDSQGYLVDPQGGKIQGFNASLQYNQKVINTVSNIPGQPLVVTQAVFALNSANLSSPTSIQINPNLTLPPLATTEVTFKGNLDAFQQPNVLDLLPGGLPSLPIGLAIAVNSPPLNNAIDTTRMTAQATAAGGFTLQQVSNLSSTPPGFNVPVPLENGFINLGFVQAFAGDYVWDQQPPVPPAVQVSETVYDSVGNPRQITVQFYQVNDLGAAGINNPQGPNQVCYAWYAFDTTDGQKPITANLLGGTGIGEGNYGPLQFYDRGRAGTSYFGDFLWFNTDGSLASSGGVGGVPGPAGPLFNFMSVPVIYLPPNNPNNPPVSPIPTDGAEITAISLNFGNFGLLGTGQRNGLYSDADGSYQVVNGVNTYVPNNTAYAASQNGYAEGQLQGLNFNQSGVVQGTFSNGQVVNLAQVELAQVQNPEGLSNVGDNYFSPSDNSGPSQMGLAGEGNFGTIQADTLEGSNVDLSVELSNMIVAQRGFETNARMISAVNDELQVLSNLGR
jgi:flagellar hook protein FlgE